MLSDYMACLTRGNFICTVHEKALGRKSAARGEASSWYRDRHSFRSTILVFISFHIIYQMSATLGAWLPLRTGRVAAAVVAIIGEDLQ